MIVITAQGRLAHQPELRMGKTTSVCEFRLLSTRFARGEEHTEAVTFFCYGELAEDFCSRVEKGQLISATGTQETSRWRDDSSGQERSSVKYKLTWWEPGPRPRASRSPDTAAAPRQPAPRPERVQPQPSPSAMAARTDRRDPAPGNGEGEDMPANGFI